jgi:hypothetical protein
MLGRTNGPILLMCVWLLSGMVHALTRGQKNPTPPSEFSDSKKVSAKVTKAQRRAQQAEFNRQLWAEA